MDEGPKIDIKDLIGQMEKPIELSPNEKERIEETFTQLRSLLNSFEMQILTLPRDEAFLKVKMLLTNVDMAINEAKIAPGQLAPGAQNPIPKKKVVLGPKVDFGALLEALSPSGRIVAERLDCVKGFHDPDIGMDIICQHCSQEELEACIRTRDSTIVDAWDLELIAQRDGLDKEIEG